jgi:hypothetical protein
METRRVWPEPAIGEDDKHYYFKRLLIQAPQQIPHVTIVNVGDKVIVNTVNGEFIAEIIEFYECKASRRMMFAINWFYNPKDLLKLGVPARSYANHEVIYSVHKDRFDVASISDLCYVVFIAEGQPLPRIDKDQTNLFFCRYFYNAKHKRLEELRKNKLIEELEIFHQKFPLHIKQYLQKDREFWDGHLKYINRHLINDLTKETLALFHGNEDQKPSFPPIPYSVNASSSSSASNNYYFPSPGGSYYNYSPAPSFSLPIEVITNSDSYFQSHSSPLIQQQPRETAVSRKSKSPINPFLLPTLTTANGVVPQLFPPPLSKPAVPSKGPSLSFKKLDFSKTDEELACELYQRYQMQLHPLIPVDLKAARDFFSKNPASLDSYVKKIKAVRRRKSLEAQKKLNPPSNSAGNQQNIHNNNSNYADDDDEGLYFSSNDNNINSSRNRTNNNVSFQQQQAQDSDNQQPQPQKVRNTKKRSRSSLLASEDEAANKTDLPLATETQDQQQQQQLGSWFSESDDDLLPGQSSNNHPKELSGSSSASFLNKKLKRKKREKVKIVEELMKQIIHEQEQQIQTERILNSDESDDDDDPGYYSEDLATIPDIVINHEDQPDEYESLFEHNRLKEEAKKNRLHWEREEQQEGEQENRPQMISDAKLSAYYLQAHEEYLRIKLQFLMNLSNQLMHGSRISRNSLKTKNRNSTSTTSFSAARKRFKGDDGNNSDDDDEDEETTVQWPNNNNNNNNNNNSNSSSNKEKNKKKMNIYGEYEPIVDGSIVVFRGDLQEIFLNVLCER